MDSTTASDIIQFALADSRDINLHVFQDPLTTKESVHCDLCRSSIFLHAHRNLHGFETHRGSNKCKEAAAQRQSKSTLGEAAQALAGTQLCNKSMSLSECIICIIVIELSLASNTIGIIVLPSFSALPRRFQDFRLTPTSTSSASSSLTVTPSQSGYSTPSAGTSSLSILPPSSPPDNFWNDLHKSASDIEQERRSSDRSGSDSSDPSSPVGVLPMEVESCAGALV